jgi:hypothetical protein
VRAGAEGHGNPHPEILRRFDDLAQRRSLQRVTIVQGAQSEIFEPPGAVDVDGIVQLARVGFDEVQHPFVDESRVESGADGLRERVDSLALHFLVDEGGQQPRGKFRVCGVIDHER